MNTLILCDRESAYYGGQDLSDRVEQAVLETGNNAEKIVLNGENISPCRGCFRCWVQTPGLCVTEDDPANAVSRREIRSDAVILLSRIVYGGYSFDVKSFLDRSIPNLSAFFEIYEGEMRHAKRYERFPMVIALGYGARTERERETFVSLAGRNALNMRPQKQFALTIGEAGEMEATARALKDILMREGRP